MRRALFGLLLVIGGFACAAEDAAGEVDPPIDLAPDACTQPPGGEPAVVVGQGRNEYADLEEGEVVELEAGTQGGHHVWLALRTRHLRQAGSVVTVSGYLPELDAEVPPISTGVTLHPADEGVCELFGLRFRVDDGIELTELYGKSLEIDMSVEDAAGGVGIGTKAVKLTGSATAR